MDPILERLSPFFVGFYAWIVTVFLGAVLLDNLYAKGAGQSSKPKIHIHAQGEILYPTTGRLNDCGFLEEDQCHVISDSSLLVVVCYNNY